MARLRARAHLMRKGSVARIEELREVAGRLPAQSKAKVSRELQARFKELKIEERIERLDKLVATNEKAVRELTRQAQAYLAAHDHQKLTKVLEDAQKTQQRCTKVFKLIERTERNLLATAKAAAQRAREVSHA